MIIQTKINLEVRTSYCISWYGKLDKAGKEVDECNWSAYAEWNGREYARTDFMARHRTKESAIKELKKIIREMKR